MALLYVLAGAFTGPDSPGHYAIDCARVGAFGPTASIRQVILYYDKTATVLKCIGYESCLRHLVEEMTPFPRDESRGYKIVRAERHWVFVYK